MQRLQLYSCRHRSSCSSTQEERLSVWFVCHPFSRMAQTLRDITTLNKLSRNPGRVTGEEPLNPRLDPDERMDPGIFNPHFWTRKRGNLEFVTDYHETRRKLAQRRKHWIFYEPDKRDLWLFRCEDHEGLHEQTRASARLTLWLNFEVTLTSWEFNADLKSFRSVFNDDLWDVSKNQMKLIRSWRAGTDLCSSWMRLESGL